MTLLNPDEHVTLLKVGCEGGSITLVGKRAEKEWSYAVVTYDCSDFDEEPVTTRKECASLAEALTYLDRYPWARFLPLELHPEFRDPVFAAARARLDENDSSDMNNLRRWEELAMSTTTNEELAQLFSPEVMSELKAEDRRGQTDEK